MEEIIQHPTDTTQHRLVREFCSEAERQIMIAASRSEATKIREEWCSRFGQECESKLLINAASTYLDRIITRVWKETQT